MEWSATVSASDFSAASITDATTFVLAATVSDNAGGGASWSSPPLVCPDNEESDGRAGGFVTLHGTDQASYKLTSTGHSSTTIHNAMAQSLAATIAALAGTSVSFPDAVNWRVEDFEILGESQVGEFLKRLCRDGGWAFRPGTSGLEVFNAEYSPSSPAALHYENWKRSRRNSQRYSQLVMQLQRKYKGQYIFPVDTSSEEVQTGDLAPGLASSTLTATDATTGGRIQYAAFYDGPSGGGNLCGFIALEPGSFPVTITSSNPALSVIFKVLAPVSPSTNVSGNLIITGRPPSAYTYGPPCSVSTTPAGGRQKVLKIESSLWESQSFMESRKAAILAAANSGCDVIEYSGVRFDPRFNAGDTIGGVAAGVIHTASWSYSGGRISQSLTVHVA